MKDLLKNENFLFAFVVVLVVACSAILGGIAIIKNADTVPECPKTIKTCVIVVGDSK